MKKLQRSNDKMKKLLSDLQNGDWMVRHEAVKALDELGWKPGRDNAAAAYWIHKGKFMNCAEIGTPAVVSLIACMEEEKNFHKHDVAKVLGKIRDARAVPVLIKAFTDDRWYLRKACAQALGEIGDRRAEQALLNALNDEVIGIQEEAAKALDGIGWQPDEGKMGATYWMVKFLYDKRASDQERQSAGEVLGRMSWQPDQSEVGAAYWLAKGNWEKCAAIGFPAVRPLFVKLQDADNDVREGAANALVQIGKPAAEFITVALKDYYSYSYTDASSLKLRIRAARVLGMIADPCAINALLRYFDVVETTLNHKRAAADALAMIGEPSFEPLIQALRDDKLQDLQGVAWALGKMGDRRAISPLITFLSKGYANQTHERTAASQALYTLTGQAFGEDVDQWESWWKKQKQD